MIEEDLRLNRREEEGEVEGEKGGMVTDGEKEDEEAEKKGGVGVGGGRGRRKGG